MIDVRMQRIPALLRIALVQNNTIVLANPYMQFDSNMRELQNIWYHHCDKLDEDEDIQLLYECGLCRAKVKHYFMSSLDYLKELAEKDSLLLSISTAKNE